MDIERAAEQLTERKMVRRGLIAGLAGLGAAAMMKLTGTEKAEAVASNLTYPFTAGDGTITHTASNTTIWNSLATAGTGYPVLHLENFRNGDALEAVGGPGGSATTAGSGLIAKGGPNSGGSSGGHADGGNAIEATGGTAAGIGGGGRGLKAVGGGGNSATGGAGVEATGGAPSGIGVRAIGGGTAGSQGSAIFASNNSNQATVRGNNSGSGDGVFGSASTAIGVHGTGTSGNGVKGESTDASGVLGTSVNQPGVEGISTNSLGIRGTSTNFVGIVGISTNSHGLYGSTSVGVNGFGIVAENLGANGPGLFVNGGAPSQILGGLQVFGPKNAVLKMQDGSFAAVYCQESPEPYFEDFGRAQLVGGFANVPIEREFATLVAGGDYMVFAHPEGDTRGLFVSRRTPGGFEVREVQGGTGNVPFTYRIVTRRKDIEGKRFARVDTSAAEKVAGVRAILAGMGTPGSGPTAPAQQPAPPSFTNTLPGVSGGPGSTIFTNTLPGVPGGPGSIQPSGAGPSSSPPNTGQ